MLLSTKVEIPYATTRYHHGDSFSAIGSCFTSEIGEKLRLGLFDVSANTLGTVFNPVAIAEQIRRAIEGQPFEPDEFFEHKELWRHFLVHSSLASTSRDQAVEAANSRLRQLGTSLKKCSLLLITLGSAWVYETRDQKRVVGHNHKLPRASFNKRMLGPDEITSALVPVLGKIRQFNPDVSICLTVSPVRHLRDGLHENNLSKASLLLASHNLVEQLEGIEYFPAYEIILDELRDYRFYEADLTHPSSAAIGYVWEKFAENYLDEGSLEICSRIEAIWASLKHKPQHVDTDSYRKFKQTLFDKIIAIESDGEISSTLLSRAWEKLP